MSEYEESGFYTDLDTILDTRLSLLYRLDKSKLKDVLVNYDKRTDNLFTGYDHKLFLEQWENRDASILKNAIISKAIAFISDFVSVTVTGNAVRTKPLIPKLYLNTYPYKLNEATKDLIFKALLKHTGQQLDIVIMESPLEAITPTWLNQHVSIMMMYEYYLWLEAHAKNGLLEKTPIPDVTLHGPAINFKAHIPLTKEQKEALAQSTSPYSVLEESSKLLVNLKLLPILFFNASIRPDQQNL